VPLIIPLSQQKIRLISVFGTGILISTALLVIIPEGVDTLYSTTDTSPRAKVGLTLLAGFLVMYLVDKLPAVSLASENGSFLPLSFDMSTSRFSNTENPPLSPSSPPPTSSMHQHDSVKSTSVGLVIHALADGIALGASVATENSALEAIIFLAIMVHKAPAAFGLAAVVLQAGGVSRAKKTLAIFSLSAPVGAILTYLVITILGSSDTALIQWWTAILLIFSGGTFLYVAVHVMQESGNANSLAELLVSVGGMLVPLLTMFMPDD